MLVIAFLPSVAFAASEQVIISDGMVFYQNSDRIDHGFMVMAYNRFNAGALICGYDPNSFTEEQKTKLTQYVSGNNFYMLCESLSTVNEDGVPSWASTQFNLFGSIWDFNTDFNGMEAYYGGFSDNELNLAKQDIQKVLNGDDLKPPDGGGSSGTGDVLEYTAYRWNSNNDGIVFGGTKYYVNKEPLTPDTYRVKINDSIKNELQKHDGYKVLSLIDGYYPRIFFYLVKADDYTLNYRDVAWSGGTNTVPVGIASNSTIYYTYIDNRNGLAANTLPIDLYEVPSSVIFTFTTATTINLQNITYFSEGGSGSSTPVEPPSNWPENPTVVTPSPPELPEPRDPVIPNPPADPVPTDPPTYITQPTYNVGVFTADLQGILDAMDEHCIHLQNALYTDLNALYNKLASTITEDNQKTRTLISNRFTWLGNVISECLDTLNDNLYDYFHWLAEQFDFESSGGYNDSTVVAWLKKIYAKLGGGSPVNPKPVDPVSDPFDFGKWLSDLWNTFIADLIAIGAEGMAAIADDLQQLIHKFPFSIPWDIAAMLALLVAEPQTPVIQFPMFSYNGSVQVIQTTIDLSPYNNYVEPVRVMIKIGFAAVLAWRTKDMMELLTMARGGNNA